MALQYFPSSSLSLHPSLILPLGCFSFADKLESQGVLYDGFKEDKKKSNLVRLTLHTLKLASSQFLDTAWQEFSKLITQT